ncbi:rho-related BTB domain-containing protein 1-like, partial [Saccoglossus kowalevskii]|uniref:Rho-related BTB domain-containing protein 2-like n=1 Tax=Saccoglossus kowalevskii TaxID=10224 RepID=A0ABM0GQY3_SACKO
PIYEKDIISPYDCRQVAKDIGATYYETSVVTMFGIRELFDNVIRAALISRRHTRFWISSLRKVQSPLLQEPYLPPKPEPPDLTLPPSSFCSDIGSLLDNPCCSDVVFLVKGILIPAHRVCLVAASPLFFDLFMMDLSAKIGDSTCKVEGVHPNMLDSIAGNNGIKSRDYKEEMSTVVMTTPGTSSWTTFTDSTPDLTAKLNLPLEGAASNIPASEVVRTPSSEDSIELLGACAPKILPSTSLFNEPSTSHCSVHSTAKFLGYPGKILDHPALASIHLQPVDNPVNGKPSIQTVVTVQQHISPVAFQVCLEYLYTGTFDQERWHNINLSELITVADALKLTSLVTLVTGVMNHDAYVNEIILKAQYMLGRTSRLRELILRKGLFSDMLIQTDDGTVASHRALLMARCDMMYAMLGGNFKESTCYEVFMPGTKHCFQALQEYLYTDQCPPMKPAECLCLIEMANFLCLPRLVALGEENIIREFNLALEKERDIQEDVINMLNVAQMHNAHQLHSWCLTFLARHFSDLHQEYMKSLRNVASEDARYLQRHRWPPTWYIKEKDYYDKEKREQDMSKRTTERKGKRKWCL